jgi:hypothetical protein
VFLEASPILMTAAASCGVPHLNKQSHNGITTTSGVKEMPVLKFQIIFV